MVKRYAVIGLGYFGERMAFELTRLGAEVIAIDNTMDKVEEIKDKVAYAIRLDSTDETALRNQGLEELDGVIVSIGEDFESALLTCTLLVQFKCKRIIARSTSPIHTRILKSIGVTTVISPEEVLAERLSLSLVHDNVLDLIPLTDEYIIVQVTAPRFMIGKTLGELELRRRYEVNLITIKRAYTVTRDDGATERENRVIGVPMAETTIEQGDVLVLMGSQEMLNKILA